MVIDAQQTEGTRGAVTALPARDSKWRGSPLLGRPKSLDLGRKSHVLFFCAGRF